MEYYTSIKQSKKLVELGLDPKTADMYYQAVLPKFSDKFHHVPEVGNPLHSLEWYNKGYTTSGKKSLSLDEYCIPCWSVGALFTVMPNILSKRSGITHVPTINKSITGNKYFVEYLGSYPNIPINVTSNIITAVYNTVIWLLNNGYIENIKK